MGRLNCCALAVLMSLCLATTATPAPPLRLRYPAAEAQKHIEKLGYQCEASELDDTCAICSKGQVPQQWYKVELCRDSGGMLRYGNIQALSPWQGTANPEEALSAVLQAAAFPYPGSDPSQIRPWLERARERPEDETRRRLEVGGLCFTYVHIGLPKLELHAAGCR